jgi:anti-sigma regulatory factor (Ser/Thr protein kinase)
VESAVKLAVTEAAANAIKHGSPEGPRNHVQVSFHLDPTLLIVDVADQGNGFDPHNTTTPPPGEADHGLGLLMMQRAMDRVEFYRDERGMLVRLTKYLEQGAREWVQ